MATYFMRETNKDECTACGSCVDICPVDAVTVEVDTVIVDKDWCIGCGLCVSRCTTGAARLRLRADRKDYSPLINFEQLHERILEEKSN